MCIDIHMHAYRDKRYMLKATYISATDFIRMHMYRVSSYQWHSLTPTLLIPFTLHGYTRRDKGQMRAHPFPKSFVKVFD